jgi:hypothetical protein
MPGRWRRQPSGPTVLDQGHPLARGLVFGSVGGARGNPDLIGGLRSHPLGTSGIKTYANGVGFWSPSTTGNGWWTPYRSDVFRTIGNEFTLACEFVAEGLGDSSRIISVPLNNGTFVAPQVALALRRVTTQTTAMLEIGTGTGTQEAATFSSAIFTDTTSLYVATRRGTTSTLRRNNVLLTQAGNTFSASSVVGYGSADTVVYLNRSSTISGSGTTGAILFCYIWNRALSDAEQRMIYDAPYDLLKPLDTQRFYLPAFESGLSASANVTVTLPRPTVTADGGAPTSEFNTSFGFEFGAVPSQASATVSVRIVPVPLITATPSPPQRTVSVAATVPKPVVSAGTAAAISSVLGTVTLGLTKPVVAASAAAELPDLTAGGLVFLPVPTVAVQARGTPTTRIATAAIRLLRPIIRATVRPRDPVNDPGLPHVLAPTWRTVDFGNGAQAVNWTAPLGPGELKAFTIDCSTELNGVGAIISRIDLVPSGLATLAGLRYYARTNDSQRITVWLYVDEDDRERAAWSPPGEHHTMVCTVTATRGQIFERTVGVTIRHLGYMG